jgi:hypothetical protein
LVIERSAMRHRAPFRFAFAKRGSSLCFLCFPRDDAAPGLHQFEDFA